MILNERHNVRVELKDERYISMDDSKGSVLNISCPAMCKLRSKASFIKRRYMTRQLVRDISFSAPS